MSEARDRKMKRERRFEMQKAEKVLRACRSRRGYELFQEQEKKVKRVASDDQTSILLPIFFHFCFARTSQPSEPYILEGSLTKA